MLIPTMLWWTARQLRSKDPAARLRAVQALGDSGDGAAVAALGGAVADPDPAVRKAVVAALGAAGGARAAESLRLALRDELAEVRIAAADTLVKIGSAAFGSLQ